MADTPHLTFLDVLNSGVLTLIGGIVAAAYRNTRAILRQHRAMWAEYLERTKPAHTDPPGE